MRQNDLNESDNELIDIWKLRQNDTAKDIYEATKMYREIEKRQQALSELHHSTRRYLREENANMLAEVLSASESLTHYKKLNEIYDTFRKNYDMGLTEDIFKDALEQVYNEKTPEKLLNDIFQIYQIPNDVKLFELMVKVHLTLHALHNSKGYSDDKYLQQFALMLFKIKNNDLFQNIDMQLKNGIENAIAKLPTYLKYLLFMPYFCMRNVETSEYIYSAVNSFIDSNSRYLWLWHDRSGIDSTGYTKAELVNGISTKLDDFKITLFGTTYNVYCYMMENSEHKIAGYVSHKGNPFNHIWTVKFNEDKIVFYQNEYIMCSISKYDSARRNINGYKNVTGINADNPKCQWSIKIC